jgi:RNA polymerase sigma-70 factor (ECF subfamily)
MPSGAEDLSTLDDAALARLVAAEPAEAAEAEVFSRFARRVRLFGLKHLRDAAEADDLVQEVLRTVLEKLRAGEVREPDRLASFVLGTARQIMRGTTRTRTRRAAILTQYGDPDATFAAPEGWGTMRDRLIGCLTVLSDKQRTVIVLSFYAERTAAEIAEELGLTPGNVRVLRHRGMEQLTACVQGEEATA